MVGMKRAFILTAPFLLAGCGFGDNLCENDLIAKTRDLDGHRVAYLYLRDCGATGDYATTIAIGSPNEKLENADVVFIADSNHGAALTEGRGIWTRMTWTRAGNLFVAYAQNARVFHTVASARGATIEYRATTPPGEMKSPPPVE